MNRAKLFIAILLVFSIPVLAVISGGCNGIGSAAQSEQIDAALRDIRRERDATTQRIAEMPAGSEKVKAEAILAKIEAAIPKIEAAARAAEGKPQDLIGIVGGLGPYGAIAAAAASVVFGAIERNKKQKAIEIATELVHSFEQAMPAKPPEVKAALNDKQSADTKAFVSRVKG